MTFEAFFWEADRLPQEPSFLRRSSITFGDGFLDRVGSFYKVLLLSPSRVSFQVVRRLLGKLKCRSTISQSFIELLHEPELFPIFFYGFQSFPQRLFVAVHREARLFGLVPFRRLLPERLRDRVERWI